jgi:hypothetical protein
MLVSEAVYIPAFRQPGTEAYRKREMTIVQHCTFAEIRQSRLLEGRPTHPVIDIYRFVEAQQTDSRYY